MFEVNSWPRGMKRKTAEAYVGGERNLLVLKHFFDLRPTISHHRNTTYSKDRVDAAWTRADQEGWPSPEKIAQVIRNKN
mgnify:FL=1|tara:strand:- start:85 stop:321 length:237 start_codon:yes stop_codon:yes gene_type:complete